MSAAHTDTTWPHLADINARGSPNGALWNVGRAGPSGLMFAARIT
jgi:hypothetical protein